MKKIQSPKHKIKAAKDMALDLIAQNYKPALVAGTALASIGLAIAIHPLSALALSSTTAGALHWRNRRNEQKMQSLATSYKKHKRKQEQLKALDPEPAAHVEQVQTPLEQLTHGVQDYNSIILTDDVISDEYIFEEPKAKTARRKKTVRRQPQQSKAQEYPRNVLHEMLKQALHNDDLEIGKVPVVNTESHRGTIYKLELSFPLIKRKNISPQCLRHTIEQFNMHNAISAHLLDHAIQQSAENHKESHIIPISADFLESKDTLVKLAQACKIHKNLGERVTLAMDYSAIEDLQPSQINILNILETMKIPFMARNIPADSVNFKLMNPKLISKLNIKIASLRKDTLETVASSTDGYTRIMDLKKQLHKLSIKLLIEDETEATSMQMPAKEQKAAAL